MVKVNNWTVTANRQALQQDLTQHNAVIQFNTPYKMLSCKFKFAWGEECSKNRKIRAKVDSRIYGRWRPQVMGPWGRFLRRW